MFDDSLFIGYSGVRAIEILFEPPVSLTATPDHFAVGQSAKGGEYRAVDPQIAVVVGVDEIVAKLVLNLVYNDFLIQHLIFIETIKHEGSNIAG